MRIRRVMLISALAAASLVAGAQVRSALREPPRILSSAHAIHSLPPELAAQSLPVHLRAVVTYYDPFIDPRRGVIFVQDASGGVFVAVPKRPFLSIQAGTRVDIGGVTSPGDYASTVVNASLRPLGRPGLPSVPIKVSFPQILSGTFDCQWVQIEGRVHSVHRGQGNLILRVVADGQSVTAVTLDQPGVDYDSIIDSVVRIDGVAAPVFNQRRQMVGARVFFPALRQLTVVQPAPGNPFAAPVIPINELFRFPYDRAMLHRVHVRGIATLDWPGHMLCIQDAKGGICMPTRQTDNIPVGALVDVAGFPAINAFKPTLEDAEFHAAGPGAVQSPLPITADQAITGDFEGKLVSIDAELIGQDLAAAEPTLMLRAGRLIFPVILPGDASGAALWKEGSALRITGVCNTQIDPMATSLVGGPVHLQAVRLFVRSRDDIALLRAPSWWTATHTLESFSVAGLLVLASFAWIVVLRHRVALQTRALRGSEERLRHLSEHDALTGLPNRILLNDRCQNSLKRAVRFESCLGLLMVDADEFKIVNDALGHQAGDKLLCELAERLCACVRSTDTVARIGGDEFIVLLPDLRIPAEAESIAAKIVAAVAQPYAIDRTQAVITVSVGVVTYPEAGADLDTLMHCADEAMYAAKEKGRNSFQVYRPKPAPSGDAGNSFLQQPHVPLTTGGA